MDEYPLTKEGWAWFAVTMMVVVARYISRWVQVRSLRNFNAEDCVMAVVAVLYTAEIVLLIKMSGTPTNLFPPNTFDPNDEADIRLRVFGAKVIVALEVIYDAAIWGCKICMLFFYANMMYSLPGTYQWTKLCASYVILGYVVMMTLYFGVWCQPFSNYWQVPAENIQCSTAFNHLVLNCVLNISSDLMIMMIPLPLLIRTHLPWRKKLLLCLLFSLGSFVIVSAALNKYYSFEYPYGADWVYWYTREVSTAVIIANIPHLWALVRKTFQLPQFINVNPLAPPSSSSMTTTRTVSNLLMDITEDHASLKSSNRSNGGNTRDSIDIDDMLAAVEREKVPIQVVRFRDMDNSGFDTDVESCPPSSRTHGNRVTALPLPSPLIDAHDLQQLLLSPTITLSSSPTAPMAHPPRNTAPRGEFITGHFSKPHSRSAGDEGTAD